MIVIPEVSPPVGFRLATLATTPKADPAGAGRLSVHRAGDKPAGSRTPLALLSFLGVHRFSPVWLLFTPKVYHNGKQLSRLSSVDLQCAGEQFPKRSV